MVNVNDEVQRKAKFEPLVVFSFVKHIFVWNRSSDELTEFIYILNFHNESIKSCHNINETSIYFLEVTVFKSCRFSNQESQNYTLWRQTRINCCMNISFIQNTFEEILKLHLIRFSTIYDNTDDFYEPTSILFEVLRNDISWEDFIDRLQQAH